MLSLAAFPGPRLEPKVHLSHVLLYEAEPPAQSLKRVLTRDPQLLQTVQVLNEVWSLDFMRDTLYNGRPFRTLSVIDEGN